MMTDKEAAVKLTKWMADKQREGADITKLIARAQQDPAAIAMEIGIPAHMLDINLFERASRRHDRCGVRGHQGARAGTCPSCGW